MTETAVEPTADIAAKDRPVHANCCDDADTALCGKDLTGRSWLSPDAEITCVVCAELDGLSCQAFCPRARGW